jgi:hypothetical protein
MPLAFIEVKKPNNQEGITAEFQRINTIFANKRFWHKKSPPKWTNRKLNILNPRRWVLPV